MVKTQETKKVLKGKKLVMYYSDRYETIVGTPKVVQASEQLDDSKEVVPQVIGDLYEFHQLDIPAGQEYFVKTVTTWNVYTDEEIMEVVKCFDNDNIEGAVQKLNS